MRVSTALPVNAHEPVTAVGNGAQTIGREGEAASLLGTDEYAKKVSRRRRPANQPLQQQQQLGETNPSTASLSKEQ